jgi:hypothetical protein
VRERHLPGGNRGAATGTRQTDRFTKRSDKAPLFAVVSRMSAGILVDSQIMASWHIRHSLAGIQVHHGTHV